MIVDLGGRTIGGRTASFDAMLAIGTKAPAFSLPDHNGQTVSLADLDGSWVLLWWYPKASTAG